MEEISEPNKRRRARGGYRLCGKQASEVARKRAS